MPGTKIRVGGVAVDLDLVRSVDGRTGIITLDDLYVTQAEFDAQGPSGRELDVATATASQTSASGLQTNVTGMEIEFDVVARPVYVIGFCPWMTGTAASTAGLGLRDGSNNDLYFAGGAIAGTTSVANVTIVERITTPGHYVRRLSFARSAGTGTITLLASLSTVVAYIRAEEH